MILTRPHHRLIVHTRTGETRRNGRGAVRIGTVEIRLLVHKHGHIEAHAIGAVAHAVHGGKPRMVRVTSGRNVNVAIRRVESREDGMRGLVNPERAAWIATEIRRGGRTGIRTEMTGEEDGDRIRQAFKRGMEERRRDERITRSREEWRRLSQMVLVRSREGMQSV